MTEFRRFQSVENRAKSFSSFAEEFFSYAETNLSQGTCLIYLTVIKHFKAMFGNIALQQISPYHFDKYKATRLKTISPVTTNIELRSLRTFLNTAVRWRILDSNPFSRMQLASVPERAPVFFGKDDFQKFLSVIKEGWFKEIVIFAVLTGLRRGEIVNLRKKDVDLERKVMHIQSSGNFKTKQGKRRTIAISDNVCYLLKKRTQSEISDTLFSFKDKPIKEDWLTNIFRRTNKRAKLDTGLHFHSLRHTHASWLAQANVSIYQISKLLGHTDVKTTQTFYAHLQPEQMHSEVNKINLELN